MKYTTYLFDFDYTLADSSRGIVTCFKIVLDRHGYTDVTEEAIKRTIGKTLEDSFSILTGVTEAEQLVAFRKEYSTEAETYMNINTFLFPDTLSTLTELKKRGARIGIISTKYRFRILSFLKDYFPEDWLDIIIGGEDVKHPKPHPEGVLLAIERLQENPSHILYIGDSTVDAETAQAAGVDFVGVTNGMTTVEELQAYPNRKIISSLSDLLTLENPEPTENEAESSKQDLKRNSRKLTTYLRSLHIRQIRGKQITPNTSTEESVCLNCGSTFTGNYCNTCGQHKKVVRYTLRSAVENLITALTHINHGFGHTLIELVTRPGYMIKDYLAGKRIRYSRPFTTLFILAAIYILSVQIIDPKSLEEKPEAVDQKTSVTILNSLYKSINPDSSAETIHDISKEIKNAEKDLVKTPNGQHLVDSIRNAHQDITLLLAKENKSTSIKKKTNEDVIEKEFGGFGRSYNDLKKNIFDSSFVQSLFSLLSHWAHGNKAVKILCLIPIFALATQWSFRKRKQSRLYNYTEHLFAQSYTACLVLMVSIIYIWFHGEAHPESIYDLPGWAIFLLYWYVNQQLFRMKWWNTALRTVLMFLYSLLIVLLAAIVIVILAVIIVLIYQAIAGY